MVLLNGEKDLATLFGALVEDRRYEVFDELEYRTGAERGGKQFISAD